MSENFFALSHSIYYSLKNFQVVLYHFLTRKYVTKLIFKNYFGQSTIDSCLNCLVDNPALNVDERNLFKINGHILAKRCHFYLCFCCNT